MKWIQSIRQIGNLPLDGGFFKCDSHFNKSCFERDLKIVILNLLFLFEFC